MTFLRGNYRNILKTDLLGHLKITITTFQTLCNEIGPLVNQVMPSHSAKSHYFFGEHGGIYSQNAFPSPLIRIKGIGHFEIKIWYLSAYPKGIQDVGVFFSSVDPILIFLGQTVLVCQSYNGRYRSLSL